MRLLRFATVLALAAAVVNQLLRPRLMRWGATPEECSQALPGDGLVPGAGGRSTMAVTIDAPPSAIWPWLLQMGSGRGGFYSWDRLDNGGHPSAEQIVPEWQDLEVGGRIWAVPDKNWFDVVELEPERTMVLRSTISLEDGASYDPDASTPAKHIDGVWSFHLRPLGDQRTRLVIRGEGTGRPKLLNDIVGWLFFTNAHWIMQTKQFKELKRRAEQGAPATRPVASSNGARA